MLVTGLRHHQHEQASVPAAERRAGLGDRSGTSTGARNRLFIVEQTCAAIAVAVAHSRGARTVDIDNIEPWCCGRDSALYIRSWRGSGFVDSPADRGVPVAGKAQQIICVQASGFTNSQQQH